jgi:hypothetical protein
MKRTAVFIIFAFVLFVWLISGCSRASSPTLTTTAPPPETWTSPAVTPTATLLPGQEPVEIISVTHPTFATNPPGGPTVEIILKNVSDEPVIFLEASLDLNISHPQNPYIFTFDVTLTKPLRSGESISARSTLFGGGFGDNIPYSLTINGTLQGNVAFAYAKEVLITSPAG